MREISNITKILTEDSSFQLIRTNPKLTGNVKMMINEAGEMWLESIKVNPELSKDIYSKVSIDTNQSHPANIFRFFNGGQTPNEIIFDLSENVDLTKTSKDFKDQYDFSHYFSGAKYLASNKYSERMSYFAPIYLKKEIPSYFVVFKITDPANDRLDILKQKIESGQNKTDYFTDLLSKASLIKTFDLSPETTAGKYIRDYINHPNFPSSPLTVGFEEDDYTNWNGILVNEGNFGYRGELLYSLYSSSQPLKSFEENITKGYSRNGILFPDILNLEFIFNDDTSNKYDFNRYLGFYVNAVELSTLEIDIESAYSNRSTWENIPILKKQYLETDDAYVPQYNSNGVIVPYKNATINMSEFKDSFTDSESLFINYITDKNGKLYIPTLNRNNGRVPLEIDYTNPAEATATSNGTTITVFHASHGNIDGNLITISSNTTGYSGDFIITKIDNDTFSYQVNVAPAVPQAIISYIKELSSGKIRFSNTKIDLGLFFGQSRTTFLQDEGFASSLPGHSHSMIEIKKNPNDYDEIQFYHPHGTRIDPLGKKYDLIQMAQSYALIPDPGDYYVYNDYDNIIGYDEFYLNSTGYLHNVAEALAECINGIRNRSFTAYAYNEKVFIKAKSPGNFDSQYSLKFNSMTSDYSILTIYGNSGSALTGNSLEFKGGSKELINRLIIDSGHLEKITNNLDSILIKSSDSYSMIRKTSQYIDEINESNTASASSRSSAIASYLEKIAIVLDENEKPTINHNEFLMKKKFKPSFGLLSFFLIKDLDFDFYSSTYTNFPEIDLYKYYFIPENTTILEPGYDYYVKGGIIKTVADDDLWNGSTNGIQFQVTQPDSYTIVSGNPIVSLKNSSTSRLDIPVNDANNEIIAFPGFSLLKDPTKVVSLANLDDYDLLKIKYTNGLTPTEYDFYKENESSDFALRSKVIPYITKWGIKNSSDSRGNPYRLNTEITFGRNNFSPDHVDSSQNPINFTHEWFYIESNFNYTNDDSLLAKNNYYFEEKFDYTKLLNDKDYFINYFTYTPTNSVTGKEVGDTQFRYSSLIKNSAGQYEAMFKGFKVTFKDVTDPTVLGPDDRPKAKASTNRFDGYKFTCLLKPVKEEINRLDQPPIKYKVIEHKDWKFIVVVIELAIGYLSDIDPYWLTNGNLDKNVDTNNFNDSTLFTPADNSKVFPYETVNGEYRIDFNSDDVSDMTHTLLYSLKSKKYNSTEDALSTVRLGSQLNISNSGVNNSLQTIRRINNINTINYPTLLSDDFNDPSTDTIVFFRDTISSEDKFITSKNSLQISNAPGSGLGELINIIDLVTEQYVHFNISDYTLSIVKPIVPNLVLNSGSVPNSTKSIIEKYYIFKVLNGGTKYFQKILEKISFAKFKKYVNTQNNESIHKFIEYYSYSESTSLPGTSILSTSPNYYLEVLDISNVTKKNQVIINNAESIPPQFSGQADIGFDYEVADLPLKYEINRYKGEYEPVVQNYSIYGSDFKFKRNDIKEITLANLKFNTLLDSMMTLSNFNHIKVADTQVLSLESDEAFLPVYPKINEIAIGQGEYFLFKGNWDWGFHYKYSTKSDKLPVSGALRIEEDDSFLAKLIVLPEYIELESFDKTNTNQFYQISENEDLDKVDITNREFIIKDTPDALSGIINLNNTLTRFLIEDGIMSKFNQYLVNSNEYIGNFNSLEDYVKQYIQINILKLYDIDVNEFYAKPNAAVISTNTRGKTNPNGITFEFLNDKDRFTNGYDILKSLQINKKDKLVLKFNFTKKAGSGLIVSPKIKIKFI